MCHTIFDRVCFESKRVWTPDRIGYAIIYTTIWLISVTILQTTCCFSVIFTVFKQIIHGHCNIYISCIINFYTTNFWNAINKWSIVFKNQLLFTKLIIICSISSSCISCCLIGCFNIINSNYFFSNSNISIYSNIYIRIIT